MAKLGICSGWPLLCVGQIGTLLIAILLAIGSAQAEVPSGAASDALSAENSGDQQIVVTALRRPTPLDLTPGAISVFDARDIDAKNAANVADVVSRVPNAVFDMTAPLSGSSNSASIFIRGIGQSDFVFTTDSGVAVYLDDVAIARSTGAALDLLDVARIEVLRGPQGTLAGRNSIGGATSVFTNEPGRDVISSEGEAILGTYHRLELRGTVNMPVGRDGAFRFAAAHAREDGFAHRLITGKELGGYNTWQARGSLKLWANDDLTLRVTADYMHRDDQSPASSLSPVGPASAMGAPTTLFGGLLYNNLIAGADGIAPCQRPDFVVPFCGIPGLIQLPPLPTGTPRFDARWLTEHSYTTFATGPDQSKFEGYAFTVTAEWKGPVTIRSISAYRSFDADFGRDPDGSPLVIIDTHNLLRHEQLSEEIQVKQSRGSLSWVAGVYYFEEDGTDRATASFVAETFQIINGLGLGCNLLPGATGLPTPLFVAPCPNIFRVDYRGHGTRAQARSIAVFGEATIELSSRFSLIAGGRWTRDRKEVDLSGYLIGGLPVSPDPEARQTFSRITPRVIFEAHLGPSAIAYASFSTGFKSGGFNQRYGAPIAAPTSFAPESVRSFELGLRTPLGRMARLRATAFWSTYQDIQAVVFDAGIPRTINAAKGRSRGVEIEADWRPVPQLTLSGSYGFLNTGYNRLDPAIIGSFGTPIVNPLRRGDDFVNAPRHSANLSLAWQQALGRLGSLQLHSDLSYKSKTANDATNTPELISRPVTLINVKLSYLPRAHWSATLFVTNLFDQHPVVSGAADPAGFGAAERNFSQPRRCGVKLNISL